MKYKSKEVSIRRSKHACIVYINLFLTPILLVFQSFHFIGFTSHEFDYYFMITLYSDDDEKLLGGGRRVKKSGGGG